MPTKLTVAYLSSLLLPSTKGEVTIAGSAKVFSGGISKEFLFPEVNKPSSDTPSKIVHVYKTITNANFRQMFSAIGDPVKLVLTQAQVVEFCDSYPEELQSDGFETFFLMAVNDELFVADVYKGDGRLMVNYEDYNKPGRWSGSCHHRLVVARPVL